MALATSLGIDATPTFVVNGVKVIGAVPERSPRAIDHGRDVAVTSGLRRADYYDKAVLGQ